MSYFGDSMEIFAGDEKLNDHFYTGQQVPISLGYFGFPEKLPEFTEGRACSLDAVEAAEQLR